MERWGKEEMGRRKPREHRGLGAQREGISARSRAAAVKASERPAVTTDLAMWRPQRPQPDWAVGSRWEEPAGMLGRATENAEPCGKKTQRASWTTGATQPDPSEREKEAYGSRKPS